MICMILGRPSAVGVLCVSLGDESKVMSWQRWVLQDTRWSSFAEGDAIDAQKWLAIVRSEPLNVEQVVLKALRPSYPCDYSLMFELCVCLNTSSICTSRPQLVLGPVSGNLACKLLRPDLDKPRPLVGVTNVVESSSSPNIGKEL